jgi:hypothetical protein
MSAGELWTAILRWDRLGPDRVRLRIPCGGRARARWLREKLGAGRVTGATVALYGLGISQALSRLEQPEGVVRAAEAYARAPNRLEAVPKLWAVLGLPEPPAVSGPNRA